MKQCTSYHAHMLDPKRSGVKIWMKLEKGGVQRLMGSW